MNHVITSALSDAARTQVGKALQGALVDLVDLSLVAKQLHWNVVGPGFRSVHLQLDEVVQLARQHSDTVAERAAAIGVSPDGRAATVSDTSGIAHAPQGPVSDTETVAVLVAALQAVVIRMRERIDATADDDPVSQDLLIAVTADLEKYSWMAQAESLV